MSKFKIDAVEVATSIHKGDFSKLRGKSFEMCDNKNMGKKYTLNGLGMTVDKLATKVDQIGDDLAKLTKYVTDGFKQVNSRIDKIEQRLDYNGLKPLPEENH